jgi:hypothetical protein
MNAIRQFIEVKDNSFSVVLPKDFTAQRVEVIIMPSEEDFSIPQWHKDIVLERIKNPKKFVDAFKMIDELEQENIEDL